MDGYAFEHEGSVFTPDGRRDIPDVPAHNAELEARELALWAESPEHWQVYVTKATPGQFVTTWLGTILGTIIQARRFQTNITRSMVALTIRGTNGAIYHGRFGDENSQLCRIHKSK